MTDLKFIKLRRFTDLEETFLSWEDANLFVRAHAPRQGNHDCAVLVTWADDAAITFHFDLDATHAREPSPLSTEAHDDKFAVCGYDFGEASRIGAA